MIYEYALEPELVASLTERSEVRYFYENLGLGQPRLVSHYPKRWEALVWDAFHKSSPNSSPVQRKRMEELIARLSEVMVRRRDARWNGGRPWLENAEQEHDRRPFRGILARANPRNRVEVLVGRDLDEQSSPRWAVPRGAIVPRQARQMADLLLPMLRSCGSAIFVDPHFGPENPRHRRPLEALLEALVEGRTDLGSLRVEVHTGKNKKATAEFFKSTCEGQLGRCIPVGLSVQFRRWTTRPSGEAFHNRYILTDLGGLIFSHGLDEGGMGETDDVNLMDQEQYRLRWSQYVTSPVFDSDEAPVVVIGTRQVRGR